MRSRGCDTYRSRIYEWRIASPYLVPDIEKSTLFQGSTVRSCFESTIPRYLIECTTRSYFRQKKQRYTTQRSTRLLRLEYIITSNPILSRKIIDCRPLRTHLALGDQRTPFRPPEGLSIFLEIQTPDPSKWRRHL